MVLEALAKSGLISLKFIDEYVIDIAELMGRCTGSERNPELTRLKAAIDKLLA